jgi:Ni/Co efflux regulator RcnB
MTAKRWLHFSWVAAFALASLASARPIEGQGQGHGRGHNKHDRDDDDDRGRDHDRGGYSDHDRDAARDWYDRRHNDLPPGLAKRDRLPPGLERQLEVRGTLPPGLRKKIQACPEDLERRLPPPPPDCRHVIVGGHLVLLNTRSFLVVDVFHFELH